MRKWASWTLVWLTVGVLNAWSGPYSRVAVASGTEYLARVMDQYHEVFYVYEDFLSAGNHFTERGLMCNEGDEDSVPPMDEACTNSPRSGLNCIRCEFKANKSNWGGWFFLNGALPEKAKSAQLNWGEIPDAGHNLKGATRLTFWARGEEGGEKVKFFTLGIGRNPFNGKATAPHPDSARQVSSPYITLSKDWKQYSFRLQGVEMTNVLLGFAWQTKSTVNRHKNITFYLDDIAFDKPRTRDPRLLVSYETQNSNHEFDLVLRNVAYTYDNAIALMAFLAAGDTDRAKLLADALVYAQEHDRWYSDGRLRNAYQGGDLALPPGWRPNGKKGATRLPGWWDKAGGQWSEDRSMVGTSVGNMAWAGLALLACYETSGGGRYLSAAQKIGCWLERNCRDSRGNGGYTAGFEGWEPAAEKLTYKSTEHNIDLYVLFKRLHKITRNAEWLERAGHARRFVQSMWDARESKFWSGTGDDGITVFRDVVPVDVQAWALLALKEDSVPYWKGLAYADAWHRVGRGYDFNQDSDGVWFEGTAHMALAFLVNGQPAKRNSIVSFLKSEQDASGGVMAADRDALSTGFHQQDGTPWLYYKRLHVGATSWLVLAERSANPFWLGSRQDSALAMAKK